MHTFFVAFVIFIFVLFFYAISGIGYKYDMRNRWFSDDQYMEDSDIDDGYSRRDNRHSFTVRTSPEIERKVRQEARNTNKSINSVICKALDYYYKEKSK